MSRNGWCHSPEEAPESITVNVESEDLIKHMLRRRTLFGAGLVLTP